MAQEDQVFLLTQEAYDKMQEELKWREGEYRDEIIAKVNDLFEGDLTDDDKLVYVNDVIKGKLLESEELATQARNNSKAQFANSPTLRDEMMNAILQLRG